MTESSTATGTPTVSIDYFSDLLCVWAYVAQIKVDELRRSFGSRIRIEPRFVSVFANMKARIAARWDDRGGASAYAAHVLSVGESFDHVQIHPEILTRRIPAGSTSVHAFVKAAGLAAIEGHIDDAPSEAFAGRSLIEELAWRLRLAFFSYDEDISRLEVQLRIAAGLELPLNKIRERIDDGRALAALSLDLDRAATHQVIGSPTFLMNEGRQKIYGNVGYLAVEANVTELLRDTSDSASWC